MQFNNFKKYFLSISTFSKNCFSNAQICNSISLSADYAYNLIIWLIELTVKIKAVTQKKILNLRSVVS